MQKKELRGYLALIIIISLFVGALGGALGSLFLRPYLMNRSWGQEFLGVSSNYNGSLNKDGIYQEDAATINTVKKVAPSVVSIVVSKALENIYNQTGPDIVGLENNGITLKPEAKQTQEIGGGTGFIVSSDGLIVTNKHVVFDETAEYTVILNSSEKYPAKIIARDVVSDLALLKIEATNLPVVDLGDSDNIELGQTVIAIGNTFSEFRNTVTRGIISGIDRRITAGDYNSGAEIIDGAIQTDAAINPGNSGGPLLNLFGQVIGINTAISQQGQSISFAIPINQARSVIESVKKFGRIVRPWIGVRYVQIDDAIATEKGLNYTYGALILSGNDADETAIVPDSPAAAAGLQEKDIILEVNGVKIDLEHPLLQEVNKYVPGDEITVKYARDKEEKTITVKLAERTK
ncbi:MAG: Protease Do [Parcubacteria group bacterium GW2011_GWC2_39_14]|nr:MAG: Protease Do [Parcubacteria group bacterium GW2011_GWC2_39_14]KKR54907.1 MAG: Protease Do [Parcubacteria group bacterium GW2011_GWA2_40_23]